MADKARYPQIPSTVWWGLRSILQRTPNAVIDERLLGVQLGVQEAAARAYVNELRSVGVLNEDGKATALAQRWRLDATYEEAVQEIVKAVYPESLLTVAPPGQADRQKVVSWFLHEGLGQGAAGNKAATYLLLSSPVPNEAPLRSASREEGQRTATSAKRTTTPQTRANARPAVPSSKGLKANKAADVGSTTDAFPLNVNVQIHISADAGIDQIEAIFSAMRRYLYESSPS